MKKQGFIYWGEVSNIEFSGRRPFVVISNNHINKYYVFAAPLMDDKGKVKITSNIILNKEEYPFNKNQAIVLSSLTGFRADHLEDEICELKEEEFIKIKEVLKEFLPV